MKPNQNTTLEVGDIGVWKGKTDTVFKVHRTGKDFADIEWMWNSETGLTSYGHITNLHGGDYTRKRYTKDMHLLHRPETHQLTTERSDS